MPVVYPQERIKRGMMLRFHEELFTVVKKGQTPSQWYIANGNDRILVCFPPVMTEEEWNEIFVDYTLLLAQAVAENEWLNELEE